MSRIYDRLAWRQLRDAHLATEPLCRHCKERGVITAAREVDHIEAISAGGDPWDADNLQSLCKSCHSKKTRADQLGSHHRGCNLDGLPYDRRHHWNTSR